MKKILLAFLLLIVLFSVLVFIFIPPKIIITESRSVTTTSGGFDSCLHNLQKWKQWWPGSDTVSTDSSFFYNGYAFKLSAMYSDGGTIRVQTNTLSLETRIQTLPNNRDSITVNWEVLLPTGNNPLTRFSRYLDAGKLKKSVQVIFDSLCHFAGSTTNVYGFSIERTTFTETRLLASRFKSTAYPGIDMLYNTVTKLRQYATGHGATEKYYPMAHTMQVDSSTWETMVAISIDKPIQAKGEFFMSQMVPMKDRFLVTDVTGGRANIEKAHNAIEKYMRDHSLSAPAIPFEILITDRSKETDSSKWETRVFYPSM